MKTMKQNRHRSFIIKALMDVVAFCNTYHATKIVSLADLNAIKTSHTERDHALTIYLISIIGASILSLLSLCCFGYGLSMGGSKKFFLYSFLLDLVASALMLNGLSAVSIVVDLGDHVTEGLDRTLKASLVFSCITAIFHIVATACSAWFGTIETLTQRRERKKLPKTPLETEIGGRCQ